MPKEFSSSNKELSNKYEITKGDIQQLEQIVSVNFEIFKGMYAQDPYSLAQYQEKLKDAQPKIFIAKIGNQIVGDSISFERDRTLYVWIMGVIKDYRNRGIASELFENNEQFARKNKLESVTVKVYDVSKEMLELLSKRSYKRISIEKSKTDSKYDAIHLELKF